MKKRNHPVRDAVKEPQDRFDPRYYRAYPAAEAGRFAGLHPSRVRRWLNGYRYSYGDDFRKQAPVIGRKHGENSSYASFLDLMDILFVARFLDHGVSLQKIRLALDEASEILGSRNFSRQSFFAADGGIFLRVRERGSAILQLLSGGQSVSAPIIEQLATHIDFDSHEWPIRWYPLGSENRVVVDPAVSFGQPSIIGHGVATRNIYDLFMAEDQRIEPVRAWWDLSRGQVAAAVEFENGMQA